MANISKISVGETVYDIKDTAAETAIATKAERTEVKNIMDAFTCTAISGTVADYTLTIPQVIINANTGELEVVSNSN